MNNTMNATSTKDKIGYKITRISKRNWLVVLILGVSGQIAWAVENTWFNTFVFDEMTPDPNVVSAMVAVSAITATVTTFIMGYLSDRTKLRWGRRKPYLVLGYILWGVVTALFPTVSFIVNIGVAIVMVIIVDAVMTFFGSTANDAAYNAWITDITDPSNRNRLQGIIQVTALIANLIALGIAGFIIEAFGYFIFFYILGGIVTLTGLVSAFLLQEDPINFDGVPKSSKFRELLDLFKPETIKENRLLFLLLIYMALIGIGSNISYPYQLIYFEHNLGFSKPDISIIGALIILFGIIVSLLYGYISHRFNRKVVLFILPFLGLIGGIGYMLVRTADLLLIVLVAGFDISIWMVSGITQGAWIQDNYPEDSIGRFQGVRMIFFVLIPMVIGPPIGSLIIQIFGIPTTLEGLSGYIPPPEIFLAKALVGLTALIPLLFISMKEGVKHHEFMKE